MVVVVVDSEVVVGSEVVVESPEDFERTLESMGVRPVGSTVPWP